MTLGPFDPQALWYYSTDGGEMYHGGSETKEEAKEEAMGDDPERVYTVALCHTHVLKLSSFFDANDWLEQIEDAQVDDYTNEDGDPVFDMTQQQINELQAAVRATIDNFQVQRGLRFKSYYFFKCVEEEPFDPRPECDVCGEPKQFVYQVPELPDPWTCNNCAMLADAFDRHG